jgi:hypothetical protein
MYIRILLWVLQNFLGVEGFFGQMELEDTGLEDVYCCF